MKNVAIAVLVFLLILTGLHHCSHSDREQLVITKLENKNDSLQLQNKHYQDSISAISKNIDRLKKVKDTIFIEREAERKESSKIISEAKRKKPAEADSILNERFDTSTDILVNVLEHDSLKLEVRSLTDLYNQEVKITKSLISTISFKDSIIDNQKIMLANKDQQYDLMELKLKKQKKKRLSVILTSFIFGVTAGSYIVLLAN